jgi:hypothetical protein
MVTILRLPVELPHLVIRRKAESVRPEAVETTRLSSIFLPLFSFVPFAARTFPRSWRQSTDGSSEPAKGAVCVAGGTTTTTTTTFFYSLSIVKHYSPLLAELCSTFLGFICSPGSREIQKPCQEPLVVPCQEALARIDDELGAITPSEQKLKPNFSRFLSRPNHH